MNCRIYQYIIDIHYIHLKTMIFIFINLFLDIDMACSTTQKSDYSILSILLHKTYENSTSNIAINIILIISIDKNIILFIYIYN